MPHTKQSAVVTDMADPGAPAVDAVAGEPAVTQPGDSFDVEMHLHTDREGMLELAELFEKSGNPEMQERAKQIRNSIGAPQIGKVKRMMNRNIKVKHVLIVSGAVAGIVATNELFGRWRKRNGKRWATIGRYGPKMAPVIPINGSARKSNP